MIIKPVGSQIGFLDEVFGVVLLPSQDQSKVKERIQIFQRQALKFLSDRPIPHIRPSLYSPLRPKPSARHKYSMEISPQPLPY